MTKIEIGSVSVAKGEKANGTLKIGELPDASPIEIPVMVVNGRGDGPTLWVQSAIHGVELCGTFAIPKIVKELDSSELNGVFVGIPAVNVPAVRVQGRGNPYEQFAHPDLNRVFPGKQDGTTTEQFAHAFFTQFKAHANYLIDIHAAHDPNSQWTIYPKMDNDASKESLTLAKNYGLPVILPSVPGVLASSMFAVAVRDLGIPSIILEVGGTSTTYGDKMVDITVQGIWNILRYLKMISGEPTLPEKYFMIEEQVVMNSKKGGVFNALIKANEKVSRGQHIGTIFDFYGEEREKIVSTVDGIVLNVNNEPLTMSGGITFQLARGSEE